MDGHVFQEIDILFQVVAFAMSKLRLSVSCSKENEKQNNLNQFIIETNIIKLFKNGQWFSNFKTTHAHYVNKKF